MLETGPKQTLVIVGGGTAGWMSAILLNRVLRRGGWSVTLVESPEIGTIGVGEATIPSLVRFLRALDIDETAFMQRCSATWKLAIRFEDWIERGHRYWHPFGACGPRLNGLDLFPYWLKHRLDAGAPESYGAHALQAVLAEADLGPRPLHGSSAILEAGTYAYHLDAGAFAQFLRAIAVSERTRHVEGTVRAVRRDAFGGIAAVELADGRDVAGDLFIDCTGFRGLLAEQTLGDPWIDWSDQLLCDRAVATPLPPPSGAVAPYTRSVALDAGWMWQIPLSHRTGCGYVYSSRHLDPDEAVRALIARADPDGRRLDEPRHLKLRVGRRRTFWNRNCIAVGLASGFVEPLESTGIHLIQRAVELLIELFPRGEGETSLREAYNARMAALYDEVRDFVLLHYLLTRRPEAFWRDARSVPLPQSLADRLDLYEASGRLDPPPVAGGAAPLFSETSYYHILTGSDLLPRRPTPAVDLADLRELGPLLGGVRARNIEIAGAMAPHAALLRAVHGTATPGEGAHLPPRPTPEPAPAAPSAPDPLADLARAVPGEGARALALLGPLAHPPRVERSIKGGSGRLRDGRFLVSFARTALGHEPEARLDGLAAALGLTLEARASLGRELAACDALHLGFEPAEAGAPPVYKLYFERAAEAGRLRDAPDAAPADAPLLVHRALKWRPGEAPILAQYHWPHARSRAEIDARLARLLAGRSGPALVLARAVLARAGEPPHLLEVSEGDAAGAGGSRLSYDLNLYDSALTVADVADLLRAGWERLGIAPERAEAALAPLREQRLGHVAGGLDRDGAEFLTLYHESRA